MRLSNEKQSMLPAIKAINTHRKPVSELLKDLKERRKMIESRLKYQQDQPTDNIDILPINTNDRNSRISETPYLLKKQSYRFRSERAESNSNIQLSKNENIKYEYHNAEDSNQTSNHESNLKKHINPQLPTKNKRQRLQQFQSLLTNIPIDPKDRTQENILSLKHHLAQNNIFFNRIHDIIATCIIKLNRIMCLEKGQTLYRKADQRSSFFVILEGKVKIYDREYNLKKICYAGEALAEEIVFTMNTKKQVCESAKALSRCYLVELRICDYKKICEEMIQHGYRTIFNEMESMLKRNYITKNWLRGQRQRFVSRRLKTQH